MRITTYFKTRFITLVPPLIVPENPFKLLRMLNRQQTAFFFVALLAWTWDAFDFFSVSLNIIEIAKTFGKSTADVTWGITVTLMLRSIGAIVFGIASDRFGRKWPFIVNIIFYSIIEICTGFCNTYAQFIGVRALFGIAMGGIYGNCAATALEDAPIATRGLLSGLLQQGYALGYLFAAAFNQAITGNQPHGWRALFWFAGGPPLLIALWRIFLPDTQAFLRAKEARVANAVAGKLFCVSDIALYCKHSEFR
jgi:SHS family lactate transporter-like MFS transporter